MGTEELDQIACLAVQEQIDAWPFGLPAFSKDRNRVVNDGIANLGSRPSTRGVRAAPVSADPAFSRRVGRIAVRLFPGANLSGRYRGDSRMWRRSTV